MLRKFVMTQQRGSTVVGFILGLVVGLAIALGVAVYVTKVPVPFLNKGMNRSADQDAAEEKKNKDWDPNAPLYGKGANKSSDKADAKTDATDIKPAGKADAATKVDSKSADPIGDLAKVKSAESKPAEPKPSEAKPASSDPFMYFVQAGAYRTTDEADAQRAKLSMMGLDAKISERDQGGRTVYRVRVGPLDVKTDAEKVREKLEAAHIDSALVRVQR
jgi:cell division protein FtsN